MHVTGDLQVKRGGIEVGINKETNKVRSCTLQLFGAKVTGILRRVNQLFVVGEFQIPGTTVTTQVIHSAIDTHLTPFSRTHAENLLLQIKVISKLNWKQAVLDRTSSPSMTNVRIQNQHLALV